MRSTPLSSLLRLVEVAAVLPFTIGSFLLSLVLAKEFFWRLWSEIFLPKHYLGLLFFIAINVGVISLWIAVIKSRKFYLQNRNVAVLVLGGLVVGAIVSVLEIIKITETQSGSWYTFNTLALCVAVTLPIAVRHFCEILLTIRQSANRSLIADVQPQVTASRRGLRAAQRQR